MSTSSPATAGRRSIAIRAFEDGAFSATRDVLAIERALEIQVAGTDPVVTMCTPGNDRELTIGLMHGEKVIESIDDVVYLEPSAEADDVMRLMLKPAARERFDNTSRNTLTNSACGVCGKPSFRPPRPDRNGRATGGSADGAGLAPELLLGLPAVLRDAQRVFEATGGLHAAGLFDFDGRLTAVREDVGRHNALDKLIGWAVAERRVPLAESILMLSGRASYELLQKAIAASIPVVCAVSAPSSYAAELAEHFDVTLVGFLRGTRFNVYTAPRRIAGAAEDNASA